MGCHLLNCSSLRHGKTMNRISLASRGRPSGFTLLEMLVVLTIIGLIAGLVGPRLFKKVDQGRVTTATTQIKLLRGAVENLRLDIGRYPTAQEGLSLLNKAPTDPALAPRWRGPYLDEAVPLDPWSHPFQYTLPGRDGQPFALYSLGADGQPGGEGDGADIGVLPAN
ncbi:type II secretion system major pseudopilin GspG [Roseateles saccharophilus]|uniref:type II secretion system major pseudopilin GspG n=1 Tax=Roseateles saccharophilus TaxID=304 RepID=UPI00286CDD38|nr:type II secretion system major pseudopilin GspG [Roseateles saccharophilus]